MYCECDLRDRKWNIHTRKCLTCGQPYRDARRISDPFASADAWIEAGEAKLAESKTAVEIAQEPVLMHPKLLEAIAQGYFKDKLKPVEGRLFPVVTTGPGTETIIERSDELFIANAQGIPREFVIGFAGLTKKIVLQCELCGDDKNEEYVIAGVWSAKEDPTVACISCYRNDQQED